MKSKMAQLVGYIKTYALSTFRHVYNYVCTRITDETKRINFFCCVRQSSDPGAERFCYFYNIFYRIFSNVAGLSNLTGG